MRKGNLRLKSLAPLDLQWFKSVIYSLQFHSGLTEGLSPSCLLYYEQRTVKNRVSEARLLSQSGLWWTDSVENKYNGEKMQRSKNERGK